MKGKKHCTTIRTAPVSVESRKVVNATRFEHTISISELCEGSASKLSMERPRKYESRDLTRTHTSRIVASALSEQSEHLPLPIDSRNPIFVHLPR